MRRVTAAALSRCCRTVSQNLTTKAGTVWKPGFVSIQPTPHGRELAAMSTLQGPSPLRWEAGGRVARGGGRVGQGLAAQHHSLRMPAHLLSDVRDNRISSCSAACTRLPVSSRRRKSLSKHPEGKRSACSMPGEIRAAICQSVASEDIRNDGRCLAGGSGAVARNSAEAKHAPGATRAAAGKPLGHVRAWQARLLANDASGWRV